MSALSPHGPAGSPGDPSAQSAEHEQAVRLAHLVVRKLTAVMGFPRDLAPLAALPVDVARSLLSGLVPMVLVALPRTRERAFNRLLQITAAILAGGRPVLADLPPDLLELDRTQFEWAGRLLPFIEPAQVRAAVRVRFTEASAGERAAIADVLERATGLLGRPLPAPTAPADRAALTALVRVLQPPAERPVRYGYPAPPVAGTGRRPTSRPPTWIPEPAPSDPWAPAPWDPWGGDERATAAPPPDPESEPQTAGSPPPPVPLSPAPRPAPAPGPAPPPRVGNGGVARGAGPGHLGRQRGPPQSAGRRSRAPARQRTAPAPPTPPAGDRTRTAHPRLEAPDRVDLETVFELRVGLSATPSAGVVQPAALRVPAGAFPLTVKLMVDGFRVLGASPTVELPVTAEDPYPYQVLRLVAQDDPDLAARRSIAAAYLIGDQVVGMAFRWVQVGPEQPGLPAAPPEATPRPWILDPDAEQVPDLQVLVVSGNHLGNRTFSWLFHSPHATVEGSADWIYHGTDEGAAEWARTRLRGVENRRGQPDLAEYLRGIGVEVRHLIPPSLWNALRAVGQAASWESGGAGITRQTAPTVLLGTADPYIPWELAALPRSWGRPFGEVLGGYAAVGRWIYDAEALTPAPAATVTVRGMAVISGVYGQGNQLPEAEAEARHLSTTWSAVPVDALIPDVLDCLRAQPPYDIVHFAVHGSFDATDTTNGILMEDRRYLSPVSVSGVPPTGIRLVFLNACQLGRAQSALGGASGMVPSFLGIGAQAAVAPLWKVDDAVARELAVDFYQRLRGGESPAEFLRRARLSSLGQEGQPYGTRLAYLYFGHPRLAVTWQIEENSSG